MGGFVAGGAPAAAGGVADSVAAVVGVALRVGPGREWSRFEGVLGLG